MPPCLMREEDLQSALDTMDGMSTGQTKMGLLRRLQQLILHLCPSLASSKAARVPEPTSGSAGSKRSTTATTATTSRAGGVTS